MIVNNNAIEKEAPSIGLSNENERKFRKRTDEQI